MFLPRCIFQYRVRSSSCILIFVRYIFSDIHEFPFDENSACNCIDVKSLRKLLQKDNWTFRIWKNKKKVFKIIIFAVLTYVIALNCQNVFFQIPSYKEKKNKKTPYKAKLFFFSEYKSGFVMVVPQNLRFPFC